MHPLPSKPPNHRCWPRLKIHIEIPEWERSSRWGTVPNKTRLGSNWKCRKNGGNWLIFHGKPHWIWGSWFFLDIKCYSIQLASLTMTSKYLGKLLYFAKMNWGSTDSTEFLNTIICSQVGKNRYELRGHVKVWESLRSGVRRTLFSVQKLVVGWSNLFLIVYFNAYSSLTRLQPEFDHIRSISNSQCCQNQPHWFGVDIHFQIRLLWVESLEISWMSVFRIYVFKTQQPSNWLVISIHKLYSSELANLPKKKQPSPTG